MKLFIQKGIIVKIDNIEKISNVSKLSNGACSGTLALSHGERARARSGRTCLHLALRFICDFMLVILDIL